MKTLPVAKSATRALRTVIALTILLSVASAQEADPMDETRLFRASSVRELYKLAGWRLLDVRRIWANPDWPEGEPDTRHNAFTDLVRFKDHWYCVFRVGPNHMACGRLRVIRSKDGRKWESVFFYQPEERSVDVRDSKLLVTPDNRLVILFYESYRMEPAKSEYKDRWFKEGEETDGTIGRSGTWISSDGEAWAGPHFSDVAGNTWLWSFAWGKDAGYAVAHSGKHGKNGALYRTMDFKEWELVAKDIFPKDSRGNHHGNEASISFDKDGNAWIYLRNAPYVGSNAVNVGFSKPPYKEWDWSRHTNINLGGPKLIHLSDGRIILGGRVWSGGGYGDSHTAIFELDLNENIFHKIVELPSQGDNAYPGIVEKDGELWISYYSTHEDPNPELRRAHEQRSCIYMVRVRIGGERFGYRDPHRLHPEPPRRPAPANLEAADALPPRLDPGRFGGISSTWSGTPTCRR